MSCIYTYKGQKFKTKQEVVQFIKTNKISPSEINLDRDVAFKTTSVFTTVQEEEVTNTLAAEVFKHAKKDIENFGSTDFTKVITTYVEQKLKKHKNDAYGDRFLEVQKQIPYFVEKVKKFYASKGIDIVEELIETDDGNLFIENVLLIDPKQNASAKIRSLISLVPKYTRSKAGIAVEDKDTFLGEPKFVSEGAMWNTLKKGLADIPSPTFEKFIEKLKEMSQLNPSMGKIIEMLNKKKEDPITGKIQVDESLRTQFFNVFALNRVEYMSVLLNGDPGKGMTAKISTTDPSSQQAMLVRSWSENFAFLMSSIVQEANRDFHYYDPGKLQDVLEAYKALEKKVREEVNSLRKKGIQDATSKIGKASNRNAELIKGELISLLDSMGIDMDISGLNNVLRSPQFATKGKQGLTVTQLNKLFGRGGLKFLMSDIQKVYSQAKENKVPIVNKEGKNAIEDNKIIKLLARKQGEMLDDLAEANTLGAEGNLYSNYSTHTLMSSLINEWNNDINSLDSVYQSAWGRGTRIGDWLRKDPENHKLKAYVLNNFKTLGKGDQGDKISKLSEPELIGASVNITLSDGKIATYMGLAEADKSRQVVIKGGEFVSAGVSYNPEGTTLDERYEVSNTNATDVLMGYFADEIFRMQAIQKNLYGENAIPENQRIEYLHNPRNAYTSYLFPEFNEPDTKGRTPLEKFGLVNKVLDQNGEFLRYEPTERLTREDILQNRELRVSIEKSFMKLVRADVATLEKNMLIEREVLTNPDTGAQRTVFKNIGIDKNVVNSRYKGSVVEAIADYTLNSIIGSIETTKLFTGDPASFKPKVDKNTGRPIDLFADFRKRIPAIIAGGIKSRVYKVDGNDAVPPSYLSAVVNNIEHPSDYFFSGTDENGNPMPNEVLLSNMVEAFNEGKDEGEKATREDMLELINNYSKVNATDAQAWITLKTFKERMLSFGKWTEAHEDAYQRINRPNPKLLPKDAKLFMQPLKTVHVEEMTKHGHRYLHYNKQSEAVIIPGLFPGLEALAKANPDVGHFITMDGKKVGASGAVSINDGMNMIPADQIQVNPVKLKYDRLYLQQDLPTKQIKDTLVGSQVVKNLLGEIVLDGTYVIPTIEGEDRVRTGREVVEEYHEVVGLLSDLGAQEAVQQFGYNAESGVINQEKFNDFIAEVMEEELTVSDIEALEAGLSIDMLSSVRKKIESKLMAAIAKKTIKLKQSGGAMVQMSSFGTLADTTSISGKIKNGITWFKDVRKGLKPMALDKKDGKLYTEKAQVLIPHKLIMDLLGENYRNMTHEQIKKMISPDVLMGISYRIPNQATASNDLFEIVGILPPEAGDTIISYNEITTKTGSDFDIDKAFIIVPNIEVDKKTGKIRRPRYADQMSDEEAYQEKWEKDWSRSTRARELTNELEESFAKSKDAILSELKELKGAKQVEQSLRDISPNSEESTSGDLVELIARYFDSHAHKASDAADAMQQGWDALYREGIENLKAERKARDRMLALKGNLKAIDAKVKAKVKERLIAEEVFPTLEQFKALPKNQKHTKAALENLRLDLMQALLGDPKTYPNAVASLDNDTLEKEAKELYEPETKQINLAFFRGINQVKTKSLFDKAKNLVGVIANQMTDHKLSQAFEMVYSNLNFQIGKTKNNESLVSSITDTDGVYTSTWLNLYMNAIVDAAKDPYIVKANINQFTAPVAFMLVRSGVPVKWVNAYIGQPILKELVELKSVREGRFAQKIYDKQTGEKLTPEKELLRKYLKAAKLTEKEYNKISLKDLKNLSANGLKTEVGKKHKADPFKQLVILKSFETFKNTSKQLTEAIRASKADVGNGKDLMQAELKEARLRQVIETGTIKNIEKKFGITRTDGTLNESDGFLELDGSAMSGTFHRNGIQLPAKMFSGQTVMSTNAVKNLLFSIIFDLNPELLNREKAIDTLMNEIYSFIMGIEGAGIAKGEATGLFFGDDSVPRQLEKFKRSNKEIAKNNILLRDLSISYRMEEGQPDYIIFNNKSSDRELYQRAWTELFEVAPDLASKLVDYSYSSSGFNRTLFSFYQFIPTQELVNRGVGKFMDNIKKAFSDTHVLQNAKDQIIRHLADNATIVKTVGPKDIKPVAENINPKAAFILSEIDEYVVGDSAYGQKEVARWLRDPNGNLYKLLGYVEAGPVYMAVSKRGYNSKGKVIKEYFTPNNELVEQKEEIAPEKNIVIASGTYTKDTAPNNPQIGYVFTENLQARTKIKNQENVKGIPDKNVKLNVTTKNNLSGIRTDKDGNPNENALGVVTKKFQQDKNGKFVYTEGNFKNTEEDFELFKKANEEVFEEMLQFSTIVFPKGFATGKAKLPLKFAEWLQKELLENFDLETTLSITKSGTQKFGSLTSNSVVKREETPQKGATIIDKNKELFMKKASEDPFVGKTPDIFVPLSKFRGAISAWINDNKIVPADPVSSPLQASIFARSERDTGITDKEVREAKKNCKID